MRDVVFVTGNKNKAVYLSTLLGCTVEHKKITLEEIQSLDLHDVVRHKLHGAYAQIQRPVLVEDVALEYEALGGLPGTFVKWFLDTLSCEGLCRLADGTKRNATARCVFGYYDGVTETYFEGHMPGTIAENVSGEGGYGWDAIFIPKGYTHTRAQLSPEDDRATYRIIKPLDAVKDFLLETG